MQKNTSNSGYAYVKERSSYPEIDLRNPYQLQKGVQFELSKMADLSGNAYFLALEKALKKISKNKDAYRDLQFANFDQVKKADEELQMKEVGKKSASAAKTDSSGHLKKALVKNEKANVSSKKENVKGKPKGVKEMSQKPKTAGGIKQTMEVPSKEQVLNELRSFLQKKSRISEDLHYKYTVGQEVRTPKGIGQVTEIVGGTVSVKLEGNVVEDFQVNVLDKQHEVQHDQTPIDVPQPKEEGSSNMSKDDIVKKLKEYIAKKKKKNEAVDIVTAKTPSGEETTVATVPSGQGKRKVAQLKQQGARTANVKTVS